MALLYIVVIIFCILPEISVEFFSNTLTRSYHFAPDNANCVLHYLPEKGFNFAALIHLCHIEKSIFWQMGHFFYLKRSAQYTSAST